MGPPASGSALRVGFEGSDALNGHRAIGRYARELPLALLALAGGAGLDLRLVLFGRKCLRGGGPFAREAARAGARVRALPLPGKLLHLLWNRSDLLPLERLLGPLDLVHAPSFLTPPAGPRARTVLTMHGIVNFVRPDLLERRFADELRNRWNTYLPRADWLISVSESSRREFLERFEFPPERVRTIPLGVSREFRPREAGEAERGLSRRFRGAIRRPYILFVGGMGRVKNLGGLLEAYAGLIEEKRVPHRLVLAGEIADGRGEIGEALRRPALEGRVVFTGHLPQSDDALPLLYSGADLLVQPSFYEGWASPPLEAMACGTPVVASSASSLPETCGEAALHADPLDRKALGQAMERALLDEPLRAELIRRGFARSAQWTWERCARSTLEVYREAAAAGPRKLPSRRRG